MEMGTIFWDGGSIFERLYSTELVDIRMSALQRKFDIKDVLVEWLGVR